MSEVASQPIFGTLTDIGVREAWPHEARDLTPWLARNLERLGSAVGLPSLDLVDTEVSVESFAADILARDAQGDRLVLIENQLEASDHTHLGQIMTYLSGLNASVMVWIAPSFRPAHLSAIRWLNEHTVDPFAFFAVRLRVVRIGDSSLAPLFEPIEQPDGWERQVRAAVSERGTLSDDGQMRRDFWRAFGEQNPAFALGSSYAASSRWLETGAEGVLLSLYFSVHGPGLFIRGPRGEEDLPRRLLRERAPDLARRLDVSWDESARFLLADQMQIDMRERANWPDGIDWLARRATEFLAAVDDIPGITS